MNKRCFLFEHVFPNSSTSCCGNPYNLYGAEPMWQGTDGEKFEIDYVTYDGSITFQDIVESFFTHSIIWVEFTCENNLNFIFIQQFLDSIFRIHNFLRFVKMYWVPAPQ